MGQKYFKGRVVTDRRSVPYVVWDGVREFVSEPPNQLAPHERLHGDLGRVQIEDPSTIIDVVVEGSILFDAFIVWTRNHTVYRAVVKILEKAGPRLQ